MSAQRRTPYRLPLRMENGDEIFRRDYYRFQPNPIGAGLVSPDHIGHGMSATVFRGKCVKTGALVAIKRVDKRVNTLAKIVGQEWETNSAVTDNTHIVNLIQLVETRTYIYFVQELMGPELFDAIIAANPGGLTEDQARNATRSLFLGLKHLHVDLNKMHRDIKPENLLLPHGQPGNFSGLKLADLGFACTEENAVSFMGTESYSSPEVLDRTVGPTKACDMWSAGVCLYIMLCGYPPFWVDDSRDTKQQRRVSLRKKIVRGTFSMGGLEWEGRSDEAKDLVMKLLKRKPQDRLTCIDALAHPWFQKSTLELSSSDGFDDFEESLKQIGENMRRLNIRRKFQRAVRVLCHTIRWKKYLQDIRERRASLSLGSSELMAMMNHSASTARDLNDSNMEEEEEEESLKRKTKSNDKRNSKKGKK